MTTLETLFLLTNPSEVKKILSSHGESIFGYETAIKDVSIKVLQLYEDKRSYNATLSYVLTAGDGVQKQLVATSSWPVNNEYDYLAGSIVAEKLSGNSVRVPRYYTYIKEYNLILREYLPGERLSKSIAETGDVRESYMDALMKWLADFQKIKTDDKIAASINLNDLEYNLKIIKEKKPEDSESLEEDYAKIRNSIIEWSKKYNNILVHGDFNPANILINEEIAVIDLESIHWGDRVTDPANLSSYIARLQKEAGASDDQIRETEKSLIKIYEMHNGKLTNEELERFYTYKKYFELLFRAYALVWG